jgi:hypothetical protein
MAGLQIVGPDGQWIDVIPADGALVINLSDLTAAVDERSMAFDGPSLSHRRPPPAAAVRRRGVLPRRQLGCSDQCLPTLQGCKSAALSAGARR